MTKFPAPTIANLSSFLCRSAADIQKELMSSADLVRSATDKLSGKVGGFALVVSGNGNCASLSITNDNKVSVNYFATKIDQDPESYAVLHPALVGVIPPIPGARVLQPLNKGSFENLISTVTTQAQTLRKLGLEGLEGLLMNALRCVYTEHPKASRPDELVVRDFAGNKISHIKAAAEIDPFCRLQVGEYPMPVEFPIDTLIGTLALIKAEYAELSSSDEESASPFKIPDPYKIPKAY